MFKYDFVFIGAGVMSATLATLVAELEPNWKLGVFERLEHAGAESSDAWNNAGTGHAALCELNYTPRTGRGGVSVEKALEINEQFHVSRQMWSHWVESGVLNNPRKFINAVPHISFVSGPEGIEFLRDRHAAMRVQPVFEDLEYTEDPSEIDQWAPLLMRGRKNGQPVAATFARGGTDVNFGELSRQLAASLMVKNAQLNYRHRVDGLSRERCGWRLAVRDEGTGARRFISSRYVFAGAGGGTLPLLQSANLSEVRGYGGFPVGGQFLKTTVPEVTDLHRAKVYGRAAPGAPPMSIPHIDCRYVDGEVSAMFGPFATFSTKFLKQGSRLAFPRSVKLHNVGPMLNVGWRRHEFVQFLVKELTRSKSSKIRQLQDYVPDVDPGQWDLINAGQRVQVIKPTGGSGRRKSHGDVQFFGTELVTSGDRTLAGLLGASPGASTAPEIALRALARMFPERIQQWRSSLEAMVPSYRRRLNDDPVLLDTVIAATNKQLNLGDSPTSVGQKYRGI